MAATRLHRRAQAAALIAGAMLGPWAVVAPVHADADISPPPGNALNPAPVNPSTAGRWMDEEGLGTRIPAARSPTGQLYNIPLDPGEESEAKKNEWRSSGFIEFGGLWIRGDDRSAGFRQYKDLRNGGYLNNFGLSAEKRDEARFVEAVGGALGMNDQFYRVQFGRYNDWKVTAFYDETPHVFTDSYRSLWNGQGTANLALAGLTPGGTANAATTQTNIQNALSSIGTSSLEIVRKKAGVRLDMYLSESWKIYAAATNEKKQGSQPFGAVFGGGGGGGNVEISESIDYQTHDFVAGAQYSSGLSSFNVRASASFFRNDIDTMTFQNPLFITLNGSNGLAPTSFTQGRFDLAPDNDAYNIKAEYARALPDFYRGNLTATVAYATMRQNDKLVAPTEYSLAGGTVATGGASLANQWNTPAALSRDSANARIDTFLADVGLSVKPVNGLDVRGKLRYYETSNSMQYQSCNPLTGQWGRLLNDGSGLSLVTAASGGAPNAYNGARCDLAAVQALNLVPSAGNIPIRSVPFDSKQLVASVTGDYRLGKASSINAALERETFRREYRERDETWENKLKLGYVDRGTIDGMIRISYEYGDRGGSEYNTNPTLAFQSASFGSTPVANTVATQSWFHTIDQFRNFDVADRRQNILNGRVDYALHQNLDSAMTLQVKDASFPAQYGRTGHQKSNSLTLDLSYQAGSTGVLYGFYSFQQGAMDQQGVQPNNCVIGTTYYFYSDGRVLTAVTGAAPPATPAGTTLVSMQNVAAGNWSSVCASASPSSPLFPDSRGWDVTSKDRNNVIGLGLKYDLGTAKLDANFTRALGRTRIGYAYNAVALGMTPLQAGLAGDGLSDLTFAQNIFNASVLVPLSKDVLMRLLVRHEIGKVRDWHYDGVAANPMPANNALYLDSGPQDYRATVFGVLFQVRL